MPVDFDTFLKQHRERYGPFHSDERKPYPKQWKRNLKELCVVLATEAWTKPTTSHIQMDSDLAYAFAEILEREITAFIEGTKNVCSPIKKVETKEPEEEF